MLSVACHCNFGGRLPLPLFDREQLYLHLHRLGLGSWCEVVRGFCDRRLQIAAHGTLSQWIEAWGELPDCQQAVLDASGDSVEVSGGKQLGSPALRQTLMQFHPWRKGPFRFFNIDMDTEWRSNLKWNRFAQAVDFRGKAVLDVGCGNGYYGWKMLAAGADFVLGCDPFLLYLMQFEVFNKYALNPRQHFVVPMTDAELPGDAAAFDITCSLGVLYHRTSPIDHLQKLASTLKPGGLLLLETLVIDAAQPAVLVPEKRYAKMRNVWFIPSIPMLQLWLKRIGYHHIQVLDVTATTSQEQRKTDWMTFESLDDFLDPTDRTRTIEGYPAPCRAILAASKR